MAESSIIKETAEKILVLVKQIQSVIEMHAKNIETTPKFSMKRTQN